LEATTASGILRLGGIFMMRNFGFAVLLAMACLAPRAEAGCVISPEGKSINVVTDNGASEEKNCAVKCQVDTRIGVQQISCGGNTPPLAKAHSLCDFDKPEPYYKKVISSEDSCKGGSAAAAPAALAASATAAAAPVVKPGTFICRISADGHSFDAMIANPYPTETSCQVNCQISTTVAGTTEQSSCTKNVAPGVGEVVLCSHSFDKGKLVKVLGGSGECTNPTPKPSVADEADKDDDELQKAAQDPAKMLEFMRKQMDPETRKLFDKANKR
jgi:hypothetical protein